MASTPPVNNRRSESTNSQSRLSPPADAQGPRRSSFSFLRRQKSNPGLAGGRSVSGGKMSRKQKALAAEELLRQQREAALLPKQAPQLPTPPPLPVINTFGGESARSDSYQHSRPSPARPKPSMDPRARPVAPMPGANGDAATESMTHRGRYSYASSTGGMGTLNSPRRVRRRKDPTPFNILVVGAKNAGKTSFINFLQTSLTLPKNKRPQTPPPPQTTADRAFSSQYLETEFDNERIGVTLWDSQGLEKNVVDLQLREMASFIESKFEETFSEEQKVVRAAGVRDTHIHCVFLLLDPVRLDGNVAASRGASVDKFAARSNLVGGLDEDLDLQVLRTLDGKTTVIPIISKADTITAAHMTHLKRTVWDSLKQAKLDPLDALSLDDSDSESALDERDEDEYGGSDDDEARSGELRAKDAEHSDSNASEPESSTSTSSLPLQSPAQAVKHARLVSAQINSAKEEEQPYIPLSIISPDMYEPNIIGRRFPWGFADPMNDEHCDFVRLRESVFSEWRAELREASRERWYEGWRTSRLNRLGGSGTAKRAVESFAGKNGLGSPVSAPASYRSMVAH